MLIVTGSDDNYVPGVLTLIASAAHHNPDASFAVLNLGMEPKNQERITELGRELKVDIRQIEVESNAFDRLRVRRSHLTTGCYLRLLIPAFFADLDRAIYMDCDMVVMGSLSHLAQVDLGDNAIAAVSCPTVSDEEAKATFKKRGTYINSGLLIMNLSKWRLDNISEKCLELLSSDNRDFYCEDQSAINIVCGDEIFLLPSEYNVYADITTYPDTSYLPPSPVVLHYVVRNKPWSRVTTADDIWHHHARRISKLMPPLRIERRLSSRLHRRCKLLFGVLRRRKKYLDRLEVERRWRNISRQYLESETGA